MTMANPVTRRLSAADAPAFGTLRLRSLHEHPDMFGSTPEEWGTDLQTFIDRIAACPTFGVFENDALVAMGVLGVVGRTQTKTRHKVDVWSVYVVPEARGRGHSRRVMAQLIVEARDHGYEAIVLTVAAHNGAACRLYESLGFFRFGTEPRHAKLADGRYVDDHLMQLDLVQPTAR
jgi:ribosomal protein S18 acetylase RimI-like enzyme